MIPVARSSTLLDGLRSQGALARVNWVQPPFIAFMSINIGDRQKSVGSIVTVMYDDSDTDSDIGSDLTGFLRKREMSVNSLHWIEVPSQASSIHGVHVIYGPDYAVDVSIECNQHLDRRGIAQMVDGESDVRQTPAALLDLVDERRDEVPRELLVNLVTPLFELLGFELCADGLVFIILADPSMTLEAKRDGIVLVVSPIGPPLGDDVMHLDEHVASLLTEATVAIAPQ